jgi:DNA-binding transcriptional regulator YiaG
MSIFENVKCDDTVFAKLIKEIADSKSKGSKKTSFPKELIVKCVDYIENTKNMTKVKFAERTGVSYSTVQSWVNKYGKPVKTYAPPAAIAPIPATQIQSIFGNMKPVKEVVKDIPSLFTPIPTTTTETLKPVAAKEKEKANALIRTPDGLEIELPIAYLASFLRTLKE